MKPFLFVLLSTASLFNLARADDIGDFGEIDWSRTNCDKEVSAMSAEKCCRRPGSRFQLEITSPKPGSCLSYKSGAVSFGWTAKRNATATREVGTAFELYMIANVPHGEPGVDDKLGSKYPYCVGASGKLNLEAILVNVDMLGRHHDMTWGFYLVPLPDGKTTAVTPYASAGLTPETGIWIQEDCNNLKRRICAGELEDPPMKNPFVIGALADCKEARGGGQSAASGREGEPRGAGTGGAGGQGGGKGGSSGSSGGRSCSKKPHPHSSGHHPPMEVCPGNESGSDHPAKRRLLSSDEAAVQGK